VNLLNLIEADGGTMKHLAGTNGGEFAGACPWCGGVDRFRAWPEQDGGRYWCRGCGKHGDAIEYLREKRGLSFQEACRHLGREPKEWHGSARRTAPAAWTPRQAPAPGAEWQGRAKAFLDQATAALWGPQGESMRQWLGAEKGLHDAIIKQGCLGYSAADLFEPRAAWGLAPALREDGTERRQWIPAGLVIPLVRGGQVHRLRVRRDTPGDGPRYVVVSGSSPAPMTMHVDRAAMIVVESELDAWLLHQEAGDLAGVVALGSAQAKPDTRTDEALKGAALALVSLDSDDAGARAAWRFWIDTYGTKVKRWPSIGGKDTNDARLAGLDLRTWAATGIFGTFEKFERFCIQTVDGGLSDGEALRGTMGGGAGPSGQVF